MLRSLAFTKEHEMFRKAFSKFVENEVVPYYSEWNDKGIVPREIYKKMGEYGYLCPWLDEKYGGVGADFLYSVIIIEEFGNKGLFCFTFLHSDVIAPYIATFGSDEQKNKWLPGCTSGDTILAIGMTEPDAGSDLAALRTRAVKDGNEYILNGSKVFISNGQLADLFVIAAKTDPDAGTNGISLFLVEKGTPGFESGKKIEKIGLRVQDTTELFFDDCRIPKSNLIGKEGFGFKYLMQKLQQERLVVAIASQALAERCLQLAVDYVKERQVFNKPLSSFQNTQFTLAEVATEVKIGRCFLDEIINQHIANQNLVQEVSMAKFWIGETFNKIAYRCLQLFGGYGVCKEYEISRIWCDARIQTIYAGTSEIMKLLISRGLGI